MKRLGIMAALSEEIDVLLQAMDRHHLVREGMREYHEGTLFGVPCVAVLARVGKVAAASTATHLIARFGVDRLLFTGVAGGAAPNVRSGDVVVASHLIQHDMDARPIWPRHEIPYLDRTDFQTDPEDAAKLHRAAEEFFASRGEPVTRVHRGLIASGDQFIAGAETLRDLRDRLPDLLCVEMEGAAVAQVCHEYGVPFSVIRAISDSADASAATDYQTFIRDVAPVYARGIIERWLTNGA